MFTQTSYIAADKKVLTMKTIIDSSLKQMYFSMTKAAHTQERNLLKMWTKVLCYWARLINLSALTNSTGDPPA